MWNTYSNKNIKTATLIVLVLGFPDEIVGRSWTQEELLHSWATPNGHWPPRRGFSRAIEVRSIGGWQGFSLRRVRASNVQFLAETHEITSVGEVNSNSTLNKSNWKETWLVMSKLHCNDLNCGCLTHGNSTICWLFTQIFETRASKDHGRVGLLWCCFV